MRARIFPSVFAGIFTLLAMALNGPAGAQPYGPAYGYSRGIQPLERLLPGIRRDHPGDFYDAEGPTYGPTGDPHYHLKWMTPDGRIEWLDTDARTGRVLGASPGRDSFDGPGPGAYFAPAPSFRVPYGFAERRDGGPEFRGRDDREEGPWRGGGGRGYGDDRERRHGR
jgi:hypothetical protein